MGVDWLGADFTLRTRVFVSLNGLRLCRMYANNLEKNSSIYLAVICCNQLKCCPSMLNLHNVWNALKLSNQFANVSSFMYFPLVIYKDKDWRPYAPDLSSLPIFLVSYALSHWINYSCIYKFHYFKLPLHSIRPCYRLPQASPSAQVSFVYPHCCRFATTSVCISPMTQSYIVSHGSPVYKW